MRPGTRTFNHRGLRLVAALLGAALLTACPTPRRMPEPAPTAAAPAPAARANARVYRIDPEQSLIQVLAMRGGSLARLGHNHVIALRGVSGEVYSTAELTDSSFELRLPVTAWTVDEPALRAGRGDDFPPEVPDAARSGTRENLLSVALLNAAEFPQIVVQGAALTGGPETFDLRLTITLKGRRMEIAAPAIITRTADRIEARGQWQLRQTALGLTPFSVMLGALQVEDVLTVEYRLVALAP